MQLQGDTQVKVTVQGIEVRLKRTGGGSSGHCLQHRGFDFQEVSAPKEFTNFPDNPASRPETLAGVLVDDQVKITLAINLLIVRQPVPFFRQGTKGLGDQPVLLRPDGNFTRLGSKKGTSNPYEVTKVEFLEIGISLLPDFIPADIGLNFAIPIDDLQKRRLAHKTKGNDSAGHRNLRSFFQLFRQ